VRAALAVVALGALVLIAGPASAAPARIITLPTGPDDALTWTARILRPTLARGAPSPRSLRATVLEPRTAYSGRAARYMVTGAYRDRAGRTWVRVQLPHRPNEVNGWVPRAYVGLAPTPLRVRVHLGARRLELWSGTRRVAAWRAGIGRPGTPTPRGSFAVEDLVRVSPGARGVYGRFILTLTAHSTTLRTFAGGEGRSAIHGTGTLGRVGRESSYGCVILADRPLRTLWGRLRPGTPVEIRA
jgi:lipoprotein-anchoring transpeptidase ErfK/SrfK